MKREINVNRNKKRKAVNKELLTDLFKSFKTGLNSKKSISPRSYLQEKNLDHSKLEVGFNSGQFHHRKSESYKKPFVEAGILTKSSAPVNHPKRKAYTVFAKYSIVFPLKDKFGAIVNYFAKRFNLAQPKDEYLNESGVYPEYPNVLTKRLYLTHNIFDAATLLQSGVLENRDAVIALRESELTDDILDAVTSIQALESIIIIDKNTRAHLSDELSNNTKADVQTLLLPTAKTLNDIWCTGGVKALEALLSKAAVKPQTLSNLNTLNAPVEASGFQVVSSQHFKYTSGDNTYEVKGRLPKDTGSMRVTIKAQYREVLKTERFKIELFQTNAIEKHAQSVYNKYNISANAIVHDLTQLSESLEAYRDKQFMQSNTPSTSQVQNTITPQQKKEAVEFLKSSNLIQELDKKLAETGVVGEERTRMLLFVVATSLIADNPLHAIVQASSGSGKSHLVNAVMACVPDSMRINVTSVTSKSFNHYGEDALVNKLFVIQDFDGLDDKALFAFRELQSAGYISSQETNKSDGNHSTSVKIIRAKFSSLVATTQQDIYYDNQSRSIVVGIDESNEQTQRIIDYTNRTYAGLIDKRSQFKAKFFLQNVFKVLDSCEVVNPFAMHLSLPSTAKMQRRLNSQFQEFIMQVTRIHQYQRDTDEYGRLITTLEDVRLAIDLFFDAIILKIDELTSSTRQFFEELKSYVKSEECKSASGEFKQFDIRKAMNLAKTQVAHHIKVLIDLEYVAKVGGSANRGYTYKIVFEDNNERMQREVKEYLLNQVETIAKNH